MSPDKKRKLRNIALLALLGLIGGTFAFTAFNQQAINDRLRENQAQVGGRVHDYFNRDTENKDVFVENYGQEPIMVRIKLSEFMEIQERGHTGWSQVAGGNREDLNTWTTYKPDAYNINNRRGASVPFTQYSHLTFGWERESQDEPWYLPTFNHAISGEIALKTAAAGHAQDYLGGGTTHPGDGTDNFWAANVTYINGINGRTWPGATEATRTTRQNLRQGREPMTLHQWIQNNRPIGNFWVMDEETGWAYWANTLNAGQATSYLLDEAKMTEVANNIPGSYYYAIHVDSELIGLEEEFSDEGEPYRDEVLDLVGRIRSSDGNPASDASAPIRDFNFSRMRFRRTFRTEDGQEFRYLENMGNGNHMIIRNIAFRNVTWVEQDNFINAWFDNEIAPDLKAIVAPVAEEFEVGGGHIIHDFGVVHNNSWYVPNLAFNPVAEADRTRVVEDGVPRAFALSLADVDHLSRTPNIGFVNTRTNGHFLDRGSDPIGWWWMRTHSRRPGPSALLISREGHFGATDGAFSNGNGGARPALIIHQ